MQTLKLSWIACRPRCVSLLSSIAIGHSFDTVLAHLQLSEVQLQLRHTASEGSVAQLRRDVDAMSRRIEALAALLTEQE